LRTEIGYSFERRVEAALEGYDELSNNTSVKRVTANTGNGISWLTAISGISAKVGTCEGSFFRGFLPTGGGVGEFATLGDLRDRPLASDGGIISSSVSGAELRGDSLSDMASGCLVARLGLVVLLCFVESRNAGSVTLSVCKLYRRERDDQ